jgi:hypothetical protein
LFSAGGYQKHGGLGPRLLGCLIQGAEWQPELPIHNVDHPQTPKIGNEQQIIASSRSLNAQAGLEIILPLAVILDQLRSRPGLVIRLRHSLLALDQRADLRGRLLPRHAGGLAFRQ